MIHEFIDQSADYNINHIEIGGGILRAPDEIILDPAKERMVTEIAVHAYNMGLTSYIWCQEIHVEGGSFPFQWDAPLVIARQAAYRSAFRRVPDLSGVVLSFDESLLAPWDAGGGGMTETERVRFVIDMVRRVVVDELGKKLIVSLRAPSARQRQWIKEAMAGAGSPRVTALVPAGDASLLGGFPVNQPIWGYFDLTGGDNGSGAFLNGIPDSLASAWAGPFASMVRGGSARVDSPSGGLLRTANEINLYLYANVSPRAPATVPLVVQEWIQQRYGVSPVSDAGRFLAELFYRSNGVCEKIGRTHGVFEISIGAGPPHAMDFVNAGGGPSQTVEMLRNELAAPRRQTLVDAAQERHEILAWIRNAIDGLDRYARSSLSQANFQDLLERLKAMEWAAGVYGHALKAELGFRNWRETQSEDEALHLEHNLQQLEALAESGAPAVNGARPPVTAEAARGLASRIRSAFPKVLLGARPREWNRILDMRFGQSGEGEYTIEWSSERPSTSRLFITLQPPQFDQVLPVVNTLETGHRITIGNLIPGETYTFKAQCITNNGEVTNTGHYSIRVEESPLL